MRPPGANPNPQLNGWCSVCEDWALRGPRDRCMWCGARLRGDVHTAPTRPQPDPAAVVKPPRSSRRRPPHVPYEERAGLLERPLDVVLLEFLAAYDP